MIVSPDRVITTLLGGNVVDVNGIPRIKDFEFSPEPKRFRMYKGDSFVFEAAPALPIDALSRISNLGKNVAEPEQIESVFTFFELILFPDSANELRIRRESKEKPLGVQHLMPIVEWLVEEYGLRPTQPSSLSSTGSTAADSTPLTDGVSVEELTHSN